jgi:hypothetical protein
VSGCGISTAEAGTEVASDIDAVGAGSAHADNINNNAVIVINSFISCLQQQVNGRWITC